MPRHSFLLLGLHQKSSCATMSRSALEGARRHIVRNLPCHGGGVRNLSGLEGGGVRQGWGGGWQSFSASPSCGTWRVWVCCYGGGSICGTKLKVLALAHQRLGCVTASHRLRPACRSLLPPSAAVHEPIAREAQEYV